MNQSAKPPFHGQPSKCPETCVDDGFPDTRFVGRVSGQAERAVANIGYARVSTADQDPALQLDALARVCLIELES